MARNPDDPQTLVSTGWLSDRLGDPDLLVLDGSWHLPGSGRDPAADFAAARIPGARFFDIDAIADPGSDLPHMAPPPAVFARAVSALGYRDGMQVVVYDGSGLFSAPRVRWTFRLMGVSRVAVLDGGFPRWRAEGRPVEGGEAAAPAGSATPRPNPAILADRARVAHALATGAAQVVDARPAARFAGAVPEPRPGLRAGHIPGSVNLPFAQVLDPDGTMKDEAGLRAAFAAAGVDLGRPVIATCGSGMTAAVLALALDRLGHRDHALYDGSWAEWGRGDGPVATTGG